MDDVICPKCGRQERDESIKVFGLFNARIFVLIFVIIGALLTFLKRWWLESR